MGGPSNLTVFPIGPAIGDFKEVPIECVVDPGRILADIEGHGIVINGAHKGLLAGGAGSRGTEEITTYFKDHMLAVRGKHKTPDTSPGAGKGLIYPDGRTGRPGNRDAVKFNGVTAGFNSTPVGYPAAIRAYNKLIHLPIGSQAVRSV